MIRRACAIFAGLDARTISEFERFSTITDVAPVAAGTPGVATLLPSISFCTVCTTSEATAFLSCTTCSSEPAGWSSAAMILPRRCRLSA